MTDKTPPLSAGQILIGPLFNEPMRVETVQSNGAASWILGLVGANSERFRKVTITAEDLLRLTVLDATHSFTGDGRLLPERGDDCHLVAHWVSVFEIRIISGGLVELVGPGVNDRIVVEVVYSGHEALFEFLFGDDADVAQN